MAQFKEILMPGKKFAKNAFSLALPIILQNFIMFALNMMDIILLQGLGDTAVASVSSANQSNLVVNLLIFGTCSGSSIFLAQCRGSRDFASMRKTVWIALVFIFTVSFTVASVMTSVPKTIMSIMTSEAKLIETGSLYLRIVPVSFVLSGLSMVFSTLLRCNEKTKLPLFASVIALSINTTLNYILIYGKLGMPAMGVQGAAVATVISRLIEFCLILYFVYGGKEKEIKPRLADLKEIRLPFIKSYYKIALPVICNEVLWGFGMTVYSAIYGRMGETTVAAMSVSNIMEQTFAVVAMGCGHITTIIIGQLLGKEAFEEAKLRAKTLALWSLILGGFTTVIMIVSGPFFVRLVFNNLTEETMTLAINFITMFACYMPLRAFVYTNIVGTLRSGGDSLAAAVLDVLFIYIYSIPVGIILGLWLKLPSIIVIGVMYGEELIKAVLSWVRVRRYLWVRKIG